MKTTVFTRYRLWKKFVKPSNVTAFTFKEFNEQFKYSFKEGEMTFVLKVLARALAVEHYDKIIAFVQAYFLPKEKVRLEIAQEHGLSYYGDQCVYCRFNAEVNKGYNQARYPCDICPLFNREKGCGNGLWYRMVFSETADKFIATAHELRYFIQEKGI